MPLRLEIKKKLQARSDRVKCVDVHPTEPWILSALYNGNVFLWDFESGTMIKSFDICELPVRSAKFIVRKQWFITASDDMQVRVFNYNTMEKIKEFEAHTDYIRYLEVHPTQPLVISAADDMTMKLWNWDMGWECTQVFEGHAHYVMMVKFNLKDTNTFASASLDRTIKVWALGANQPYFSLEGHERGVNCIDYYPGGDKPYLISGADDTTVKIWDYQTKACIQTLDGHANNVCSVLFHPRLPILLSGSEDGTVRIWHSTTFRAESTLNYGMERAWSLAVSPNANKVAIGYDEGTVCIQLGQEAPVASMDRSTGKLVYASNNDILTAPLKGMGKQAEDEEIADGERLPIVPKDLGSTEVFPQTVKHNCNGRFLVVCGDGEFIIYTSQALRNKAFGSALDFAWSATGTGDYAIRESISKVKTFKNFKEHKSIKAALSSAEGLFGGHCLAVRGADCVVFYDWNEGIFVRKIDVVPRAIYWNESGSLCLLVCDDACYVLKYDADAVATAIENDSMSPEEGVEGAFELLHELSDNVQTGQWVGDCFIYTNSSNRLNYFVGGEIMTLAHLDHTMYLLGYLPKEDRVFLMDNARNVVSFRVLLSVLEFQTAVVRGDIDEANVLIQHIPEAEHSSVARFLESQGHKEQALQITKDPDQRFDLAMELEKLDVAHLILQNIDPEERDTTDTQAKWKRLGDVALAKGNLQMAQECALSSGDMAGLLLLHTSTGNAEGMAELAVAARAAGKNNVSFLSLFLLNRVEDCIELLIDTGRIPEAAFMARTYMPSMMSRVVALWREDLAKVSERAAKALADPAEFPNLFPDLEWALKVEAYFKENRTLQPASMHPVAIKDLELDLIQLFKERSSAPAEAPAVPPSDVAEDSPPVPPSDDATGDAAAPAPPASSDATAAAAAAEDEAAKTAELAAQAAEADRLAAEKAEAERLEAERIAAEKAEAARLEAERIAAEKAEAERVAAEQAAAKLAAEKAEAERLAAEKAEAERIAAEKAEAERLAAEAEAKRKAEEEALLNAAIDAETEGVSADADDILGDDDDDFGEDW